MNFMKVEVGTMWKLISEREFKILCKKLHIDYVRKDHWLLYNPDEKGSEQKTVIEFLDVSVEHPAYQVSVSRNQLLKVLVELMDEIRV